jgi:hypothetical protein
VNTFFLTRLLFKIPYLVIVAEGFEAVMSIDEMYACGELLRQLELGSKSPTLDPRPYWGTNLVNRSLQLREAVCHGDSVSPQRASVNVGSNGPVRARLSNKECHDAEDEPKVLKYLVMDPLSLASDATGSFKCA